MIDKAMYREIQALKRQGLPKAAIVKALELDPKTVAKYFGMEEESWRAYRREHLFRDKEFDRYRGEILEIYEANGFRKLEMASVYDYLEERYGALPANEQSLRNDIGYLLRTEALKLEETGRLYAKVPELPFGKQMQLDFGQYRCRSGLRLYIFAALLSASRYKCVIFQERPFRTLDVIRLLLDVLISPDLLIEEGLFMREDLEPVPLFPDGRCDFAMAIPYKTRLLELAYQTFRNNRKNREPFEAFCLQNISWLEDFSLFIVIKNHVAGEMWAQWPEELKDRVPQSLEAI